MADVTTDYDEQGLSDPATFPDAFLQQHIHRRKREAAALRHRLQVERKPVRGMHALQIEVSLLEELQQYRAAAAKLRASGMPAQLQAFHDLLNIKPGVTLTLTNEA